MVEGAAASETPERSWTIAFATASYVAREIGYELDRWIFDDPVDPFLGGWRRCAAAVTEHFRPVSGFARHFDAILADIAAAGFEAVEIWGTHLSPAWATDEHIELAQQSLARHRLTTVVYGADFGATHAEAARACEIANALGSPILSTFPGPFLARDRRAAIELVRDQGLRMALENHPEHPTPEAFLEELGADPFVGAIVDTGWWGTHGYDAAEAIRRLGDRIFHVHLKDVVRPGTHDPCILGDGCVPIEACLEALEDIGYEGAISLEYLSANIDPTEACRVMREALLRDPRFDRGRRVS